MVGLLQSDRAKLLTLLAGFVFFCASLLVSILKGYHTFSFSLLWESIFYYNASTEHILIRTVRMPAAFIAATVGASLAIAGALMQVLTKNPLASPSLFGINSGAVLFIVLCLSVFKLDLALKDMTLIAFLGAGVTALFVLALGSLGNGGSLPLKLTLAGAAVSAFASSITSGIMLLYNQTLSEALFWLVGSVSGRKMEHLITVIPYILIGWMIAFVLAKSLNVMGMGDDIARGLGQRIWLIKGMTILVVILLAGGSVALAGPIAFIGLIVPHLCRYLVGNDHIWVIPYSAVAGAALLVSADTVSRFILMPKEVPVGVTTALLGVPFLIYIARRRNYE
ncbi:FecCD family ABC transporter permease [Caldalkalibacillus mannanilyticus]|uniref:FecCD family ABC transporter permease n=1 Tax=Caldalkalibacillus mannanilyticus TaxID=1418 RepID=UPI0004683A4C|nr:iron ABC transporter permease [Caldalkalibacillus mannanilyticus]